MAKFRMVQTDFWRNPSVSEEMSPEDKLFFLYLLTNPNTTQIGIYRITLKLMACDLGYSIESVKSLMDRFIHHHKVIRYNPETRELAIKNWGKYNLLRGGKPVMDCLQAELKEVKDTSLIQYVSKSIEKGDIYRLFESFQQLEELSNDLEVRNPKNQAVDDTFSHRDTIRGQEEEKEEEKQQQQESFNPSVENMQLQENSVVNDSEIEAVKEIIEFWDNNGFGLSNINAKQQLLSWLEDSRFLKPKQVILKAMNIACANNKRMLSYVTGILKNWENEALLTVEEIDSYQDKQKTVAKPRPATETISYGRAIPSKFVLDLTAGED